MVVYPAIDIAGGRVARDGVAGGAAPVAAAAECRDAGAAWLHVVDMDRVFGRGDNRGDVQAIAALPDVLVQMGGGHVERELVLEALEWGIHRVVVGASAVATLGALATAVGPERLAVGIDVRHGVTWGRVQNAPLAAAPPEIVSRAAVAGVTTVVYRDVDRDGTLVGADFEGGTRVLGCGADVILAGGIASVAELKRARRAGFAGAIVGRALHDRRFTLEEALACSA